MSRSPISRVGMPLVAAALLSLSGCVPYTAAVIRNDSGSEIRLVLVAYPYTGAVDGRSYCPLAQNPIKIRETPARSQPWDAEGWDAAPGVDLDVQACRAAVRVPDGMPLLAYVNGGCSDYKVTRAIRESGQPRPPLKSAVIASHGKRHEWVAWDTAKQFKRVSSTRCELRWDRKRG